MRLLFAFLVAAFAVALLPTAAAPAVKIGVSYSVPAWSPDGARIAWASDPFIPGSKPTNASLPPSQIWTANANGSGAAPLIGGLINSASQIIWPGSQEILYDAFGRVGLARPDGTHKTILRSTGTTFSTDAQGTRVASQRDFGGPIVVAHIASGKRVRIRGGKFSPALSPNGRRIAFNHGTISQTRTGNLRYGLFVARANGKGMHRVAAHGSCASWSPRGNEIAFLTLDALRVVRPDGSHERVLVKGGGVCSVPPLMAWSPDDRQIAYVRGGRIVIVNVASARTKKIWAFRWVDGFAWSPDSKQLLVTARLRQNGCSSLWTIDANGKNKELIRSC